MKEIPLTQGYTAKVDDYNFSRVTQHSWSAHIDVNTVYGRAKINSELVLMHRFILGLTDPMLLVDHIDRDGLNCLVTNLRVVTKSQSNMNRSIFSNNTSGYRGVSFKKQNRKYCSYINLNGQRISLGYYLTAIEAAIAYDTAAKRHHGEYAVLNFPEEHHAG